MPDVRKNVVTGAFGLSGRFITRRLLEMGEEVKTITSHPRHDDEFGDRVKAEPLNFNNPEQLTESLRGADTLYSTYWIRFEYGDKTFDRAVENTKTMLRAARDAGVRRIVHYSIANPSIDSDLPYYRGKARIEQAIRESGLSYGLVRPTVLFGGDSILINNIAWFLRHSPVFGVPGDGEYEIQPAHVDDVAGIAVELGHMDEDIAVDAAGPDQFTFNEMLKLIADTLHSKTLILHLPPALAIAATRLIGIALDDVVMTRDEVQGLMRNLLVSSEPPRATTRLADWLAQNPDVGRSYFSELKRHYK